jgi:thiol-disulfide isomerase/thioredoxin
LLVGIGTFPCRTHAQSPTPFGATYSPVTKFDPQRDAAKDIADALREALRSDRRVLLDVGGEWCIWCRRLDTLFIRNADLADFLHGNYVVVKVNYSKENKNESVLSRYPNSDILTCLFLIRRHTSALTGHGELESGKGHDPAKVGHFLKREFSRRRAGDRRNGRSNPGVLSVSQRASAPSALHEESVQRFIIEEVYMKPVRIIAAVLLVVGVAVSAAFAADQPEFLPTTAEGRLSS